MTMKRTRPETLRLKNIAPLFTVNDCQASLAWYRDVVGFHVKETWENDGKVVGAELVAGSETLMITQDDGKKGWDRVKGQGMRLFFTTTQSVDDIAEAIVARGGTLASEPADTEWGSRALEVTDPDGFLITITSPAV